MNSEYGTESLLPWRASNCLTTVRTTRPMTSQMPMFFNRLFNRCSSRSHRGPDRISLGRLQPAKITLPPWFPTSHFTAAPLAPPAKRGIFRASSIRSEGDKSPSKQRPLRSAKAFCHQEHLAAAVPRCLRLPYVDLGEALA